MRSIIRFFLMITLTLVALSAYAIPEPARSGEGDNTDLEFHNEGKKDDKNDRPRLPEVIPVNGYFTEIEITVYGILECKATVELLDCDGTVIISRVYPDIKAGVTIPRVIDGNCAAAVRVRVNDRDYKALLIP